MSAIPSTSSLSSDGGQKPPSSVKGSPVTPGSERRQSMQVAGRKEIGDFFVGRVLGEGAYARVYIVRAKDSGKDYAMKVMEKKFILKEGKSKEVQMERRVLSDVSHSNVVRLFFSFHDKDRLYMVLDLCPGGELARLVRYCRDEKIRGTNRALSEDQTRFYLAETVSAVQHLHSIGILHRDLKPENILISASGHVKLTDFGTAKDLKASKSASSSGGEAAANSAPPRKDTFCGTAEYVSPEVLQDAEAGIGADLWALGVMTYAMLVGRTPFLCESEFLTFQCILTYAGVQDKETDALLADDSEMNNAIPKKTPETFDFPTSSNAKSELSHEALDLVKKLLHPTPEKRLGISNKTELRQHGFFQSIDFSNLDKLIPPVLPYKMDYDAPNMDGAKSDWLVTDDGDLYGVDAEEEELSLASTPRKKQSSPAASSSRNSTGTSNNLVSNASSSGLEKFLLPDESVVLDGAVSVASYGGLVSNRRHLVLTDKGRCLLIDPSTVTSKEEMMVINATVTVKSNGKDFDIVTPRRSLKLKDLLGNAERWKEAINKLQNC